MVFRPFDGPKEGPRKGALTVGAMRGSQSSEGF